MPADLGWLVRPSEPLAEDAEVKRSLRPRKGYRMPSPCMPTVVRLALPTPDVVLVRAGDELTLFADESLPADTVLGALADVDQILAGPAYWISPTRSPQLR